jgi:TIR domain
LAWEPGSWPPPRLRRPPGSAQVVVTSGDSLQSRAYGQVRYVTAPSACGVFISYRRTDAGPYARLLKVQLSQHLAGAPVFMDLDSIEVGTDFAEAIEVGVRSCRVLIALIGPRWLTVSDAEGRRRLDNPDDYVRFEIRTALERSVRVIPVLLDDAAMPQRQDLPDDLAKLARLNALQMSYERYEYDESRLITVIGRVLAEGKAGLAEGPWASGSPEIGAMNA